MTNNGQPRLQATVLWPSAQTCSQVHFIYFMCHWVPKFESLHSLSKISPVYADESSAISQQCNEDEIRTAKEKKNGTEMFRV